MRQWNKQIRDQQILFNLTILEYFKKLKDFQSSQQEANIRLEDVILDQNSKIQDHNYKITGLTKRLENTEHNYKVMKDLSDHDRDTNENVYIALAKMRDKINNLENGNKRD
jgi:ABC-type uncharacterized transport system auxiliary subunit